MGTPSDTFVDPSIAANSGAGTIGDPYGDLQYALDQVTRDSTNGDQFNIKAGTDEILSAVINYTTYGTTTVSAPVIFRGYTSAKNDGGIGGIDGNGNQAFGLTSDFAFFIDLHMHNSGANVLCNLDFNCGVVNCEFNDSTNFLLHFNRPAIGCFNSHFHDGKQGLRMSGAGLAYGNYFENDGVTDFEEAIALLGDNAKAMRNIISIDGASDGIGVWNLRSIAMNNSVLSAAGTGTGIEMKFSGDEDLIMNNIVEGFSGTGGKGYDFSGGQGLALYGNNAAFNNTTNYSGTVDTWFNNGDNEVLGSSGFAKSGSDNRANRFVYFAPLDIDNILGGSYIVGMNVDKGAVQKALAAGGMLVHPGMGGGARG